MNDTSSVYNKVRNGYAVVETTRIDEWKRFGKEALGLHLDEHGSDLLAFRIDDWERRLIVRRGGTENFAGLGLEIADRAALDEILGRLEARGIAVDETEGAEADLRGVERFWTFVGPKRQNIELFLEPRTTEAPLEMTTSGFYTGDSGLCHYAITTKAPDAMTSFWQEIFDAKTSDHIEANHSGVKLRLAFLRFNERHHSIAVGGTRGLAMDPIPSKIQHMALEVQSIHDVISAYERCRALGFKIAMSLGKHPNDEEISFYVFSPSGFEIEIGWEPIRVTEERERKDGEIFQGVSVWGHHLEDQTLMDNLRQAGRGIGSLFRKEYRPF